MRGIYKIKRLNEIWKEYIIYLKYLCRLFAYVDKSFVREQKKMPLYTLGVEKFKEEMLSHKKI
jgi:hypothetical protein